MTVMLNQGIRLLSGALFDYNDPASANVTIEDIVIGLSNICRFSGQINQFYSVAQHCVNVSRIVPEEHAFTALMHDTAEAFMSDIPISLKFAVPVLKDIEDNIESAMSEKFGYTYPLPAEVKDADFWMLAFEKEELKNNFERWELIGDRDTKSREGRLKRAEIDLSLWSPKWALSSFWNRYKELKRVTE